MALIPARPADKATRAEWNAYATELGVADADQLPNKGAVKADADKALRNIGRIPRPELLPGEAAEQAKLRRRLATELQPAPGKRDAHLARRWLGGPVAQLPGDSSTAPLDLAELAALRDVLYADEGAHVELIDTSAVPDLSASEQRAIRDRLGEVER